MDTTVQIKNIKYPHDAYLLGKARSQLVTLAASVGIKLNETYAKRYQYCLLQLWRYKADSRSKQRARVMRHMKTLVGRIIHRVEKYWGCNNPILCAIGFNLRQISRRLLASP